jgi:hypothetical protein
MPQDEDLGELRDRWAGVARRHAFENRPLTTSLLFYFEDIGRKPGGPGVIRRRNWIRLLDELTTWSLQHGRAPTHSRDSSKPELRLTNWARYQRRHEADLSPYQRQRVELVPFFLWEPREEEWDERFDELEACLLSAEAMPKHRSSSDADRALARWAERQRASKRRGSLPKHRVDALESLAGWSW